MAEPGAGGRSQIEQEFAIADLEGTLSFRYGLFSNGATRISPVPPDSFQAFLLDPDTVEPLLIGAASGGRDHRWREFAGETRNRSVVGTKRHIEHQPGLGTGAQGTGQ